jgi:type I restriction enzyme S subunit
MGKAKYPKYKPSKTLWQEQIPSHWQETELRMLFADNKNKNVGLVERNLLSLSYGKLKRKDIDNATGLVPASFEGYQIIDEGYIVLRFTDLQNDKKSLRVGYSNEKGIITNAYIGLAPKTDIHSKYFYYQLHFLDKIKYFYNLGGGVRQSLAFKEFGRETILVPEKEEQIKIANFLDSKLGKIERFIIKKKQLIKLMKEKKATVIKRAIFNGLKKNTLLKDSHIETIGKIPSHWNIIKNKYLHKINMGQSPLSDDYNFIGIGYPFLQGNAEFGSLSPIPKVWCSNVNKIAIENDILLSVRAPIGAVNIANQKYGIGRGLCAITCNSHLKFWYYQFWILKDILNSIGTGSTYKAISIEDVKNTFLIDPPNIEKEVIEKHLDVELSKIDKIILKIEKELLLTEEYKTSIIAEAVTGKIDLRDYELATIDEVEIYEELEEELDIAAEDKPNYEIEN